MVAYEIYFIHEYMFDIAKRTHAGSDDGGGNDESHLNTAFLLPATISKNYTMLYIWEKHSLAIFRLCHFSAKSAFCLVGDEYASNTINI